MAKEVSKLAFFWAMGRIEVNVLLRPPAVGVVGRGRREAGFVIKGVFH